MGKIEQILQDMRNLIEESKRVPLTYEILIEKTELLRLVDALEVEISRKRKVECTGVVATIVGENL